MYMYIHIYIKERIVWEPPGGYQRKEKLKGHLIRRAKVHFFFCFPPTMRERMRERERFAFDQEEKSHTVEFWVVSTAQLTTCYLSPDCWFHWCRWCRWCWFSGRSSLCLCLLLSFLFGTVNSLDSSGPMTWFEISLCTIHPARVNTIESTVNFKSRLQYLVTVR